MDEIIQSEELISKRDLLEKYGISYGALYRWKRKGLIPKDWFIKKSTTTGQETFFPRAAVCERMELILNMKSDILLDELAKKLGGDKKSEACITIRTVFGDKTFYFRDITDIVITDKNGDAQSALDDIKKMAEKENIQ